MRSSMLGLSRADLLKKLIDGEISLNLRIHAAVATLLYLDHRWKSFWYLEPVVQVLFSHRLVCRSPLLLVLRPWNPENFHCISLVPCTVLYCMTRMYVESNAVVQKAHAHKGTSLPNMHCQHIWSGGSYCKQIMLEIEDGAPQHKAEEREPPKENQGYKVYLHIYDMVTSLCLI